MKKNLVKIILAVFVIVGVIPAFQSPDYKIERSILIPATPDAVFPYLVSTQKLNDWMPWSDVDPGVKMEEVGPAEGLGAMSKWSSEGPMGTGEAEIVEVNPFQSVKTQIRYFKPFEMTQVSEMSLLTEGQGTRVTWSVVGQNNYFGRLMCLFMNMDKHVGGNFEKGLEKLKSKIKS